MANIPWWWLWLLDFGWYWYGKCNDEQWLLVTVNPAATQPETMLEVINVYQFGTMPNFLDRNLETWVDWVQYWSCSQENIILYPSPGLVEVQRSWQRHIQRHHRWALGGIICNGFHSKWTIQFLFTHSSVLFPAHKPNILRLCWKGFAPLHLSNAVSTKNRPLFVRSLHHTKETLAYKKTRNRINFTMERNISERKSSCSTSSVYCNTW